jgi:hypothetical protein
MTPTGMTGRLGTSLMYWPTITVSRQITGGEVAPINRAGASGTGSPDERSRSTSPSSPNPATGVPLAASSAIRRLSPVAIRTRASFPARQKATPRCWKPLLVG